MQNPTPDLPTLSVLVRNLAPSVTEAQLREHFQPHAISEVSLLEPLPGAMGGVRAAFLFFNTPGVAETIMFSKQNSMLGGLPIAIEPSRKPAPSSLQTTVVIRGLPADTTEARISQIFPGFARILLLGPRPTNPLSAAYIQFRTVADSQRALEMNGREMDGQKLVVEAARSWPAAWLPPRLPRLRRERRPRAAAPVGAPVAPAPIGLPVAALPRRARAPRQPRMAIAPVAGIPQQQMQMQPAPVEHAVVVRGILPPVSRATTDALRTALSPCGTITRITRLRPRGRAPAGPLRDMLVVFEKPEEVAAALKLTGQIHLVGIPPLQYQEQEKTPLTVEAYVRPPRPVPVVPAVAAPAQRLPRAPRAQAVPVAAATVPAVVAALPTAPLRGGRVDLMQELTHSKHPAMIMLKRLLFTPHEFRGNTRDIWATVKKTPEEKAGCGLLDLSRFVAILKDWSWDGGCHICAIANTISMLQARNIYTHGYLILVGSGTPVNTKEDAEMIAHQAETALCQNLLPTEACKIRVQHLEAVPAVTNADGTVTEAVPENWFVTVEILPQDLVVSFAGSVMLWDPLNMRTAEVHSPAEIAILQAELSRHPRQLQGAGRPLSCAALAEQPILMPPPGQRAPMTPLTQAVLRDLQDIDVDLLIRFLSDLPALRAPLARDIPAHTAQGFCDSNRRCGPQFDQEMLAMLRATHPTPVAPVAPAPVAPAQPEVAVPPAGQFAYLRGLPQDITAQEIMALFPKANLTPEKIIITRGPVVPVPAAPEGAPAPAPIASRNAFVEFANPEECRLTLGLPAPVAPAPVTPANPDAITPQATLNLRDHQIVAEIAHNVPRSRMPRRPRAARPRVAHPQGPINPAAASANLALVLEGLGLWPYQAARILFGKRPAAHIKVTIEDPNAEEPVLNKGLAELLSVEFLDSLCLCMSESCQEPLKSTSPAVMRAALVETLVNAIAHSDYHGGRLPNIELHIRGDSVTVTNDIVTSQASLFAHGNVMRALPMSVNPIMTQFFVRCGLMKGLGLGRQEIYLSSIKNGAPLPKTEITHVAMPISMPKEETPRQPHMQWSVTLYSAPHPQAPTSVFTDIATRLRARFPETQDDLLMDSILLICAELCAEPMRLRNTPQQQPATKPATRPLNSVVSFVGAFFQRDLEGCASRLQGEAPFLVSVSEAAAGEEPASWIQLADWAWDLIRQHPTFHF
eukprot:GAFH01000731.1.p1 GENE.GAFH01000731.1~~GAFH01000731.1.p1  ORF type:complete len:1212 (+),score=485.63 GAFH01000731.1:42-3638(+)